MYKDTIKVRGARQHNLKNVDLDIPKQKLVVFTGVSGSGKSSLAFDTIYAEGQRRYVESLSTYARQFLGIMGKPDVDLIEGLSPAISIDQKTVSRNPRSTVGTVTEIYDYLRLLFARIGHPHCPICGREIASQSVEQIVDKMIGQVTETAKLKKQGRFLVLAPVVKDRKGGFVSLFENLTGKGYRKARIDGVVKDLREDFVLLKTNKHTIDAVVDRFSVSPNDLKDEIFAKTFKSRLTNSVEQAVGLSDGLAILAEVTDKGFEMPETPKNFDDHLYSEKFSCPGDNITLPEVEPRTFSFNSPHGACAKCTGLGKIKTVNTRLILAPLLSIKEGGVVPFATIFEHDTWFARLISQVAKEHNISLDNPIKDISEDDMNVILYGTGEQEYVVAGKNRQGGSTSIQERFSGVVGEIMRRYEESGSDYMKAGIERYLTEIECPDCAGARLSDESLAITILGKNIHEVSIMSINDAIEWVKSVMSSKEVSEREKNIAKLVVREVETRLQFLSDVGLEYLDLTRSAATLAGGEAQRIRLASQIGSGLTGVLYVLDEPTIGLHPRDNAKLITTLQKMRDLGNTVIVVEHDKDVMEASDMVFDFGPGAGKHGGAIVASGTVAELKRDKGSLTGRFLSGARKIQFQKTKNTNQSGAITLKGARQFNLDVPEVAFPLGKLIGVTGVSGSGKSTLVVETLYHALAKSVNKYHSHNPGEFDKIEGVENVNKVILIDQSPIGRTPRSNPATYTKLFDPIRDVFAGTREAKALGFKKGRFSFNVKGGRCEVCEGQGQIKIEMQFMPDIWVECEVCRGARYNSQTLDVHYKGKNISDVLHMTVEEALEFFHVHPGVMSKLETLKSVGLGYMELGQPATTLSGGEAQRIKLATELSRRDTGKTVYILDEPTTGLHFADLEKLVAVFKILVERGNTVIVIEHNLDVIKNADYIIDLGPEGGSGGGKVVATGTPREVSRIRSSHTGKYLARYR